MALFKVVIPKYTQRLPDSDESDNLMIFLPTWKSLIPVVASYVIVLGFMSYQSRFLDAEATKNYQKLSNPLYPPIPVPDLRFNFSPNELRTVLFDYYSQELYRYKHAELADLVYMWCYGILFGSVINLIEPGTWKRWISWFIFIADGFENAGFLICMYKECTDEIAEMARMGNVAKWSMVYLYFAMLAHSIFKRLFVSPSIKKTT